MKTIPIAFVVITIIGAPLAAANNYTYLALGDSVPFGMNVTLLPPYNLVAPVPSEFIGYPEVVAANQHISELNASCPGETSGSFLDASAADNGCNSPHIVPSPDPAHYPPVSIPAFKTTYGLHADYTGAQMDFALSQLKSNKKIDLVSLNIGANDVLLLLPQLEQCGADTTCVGNLLTPTLNTYATNLIQILLGLRAEYKGTLVLMTYYSPSPALNSLAGALNDAIIGVATGLNQTPGFVPITIVDGFTPFIVASGGSTGDPCVAGLVITLPASPYDESACDIHPSPAGRDLLASLLAAPPATTACNGSYQGEFIGNLSVSKGETCAFVGGGVTGNITQAGGTLVLTGTVVGGNVQIQGGGVFSLTGSAGIKGNLQIQNLPASSVLSQVCGVDVSGNLQYQNSAAPVQIGAMSLCAGNTVGGNLQVTNNKAAVAIFYNTVTGNLQVQNDTSSTTVTGNKVAKNLQCSNNTKITGTGNSASQKQGQCAGF